MRGLRLIIDLTRVVANEITITEYLSLYYIRLVNAGEDHKLFFKSFLPSDKDYTYLGQKGFVVTSAFSKSQYELTDKGRKLFPDIDNSFEEFYNMFPHKVPDSTGHYRPVSTKDITSVSAQATRKLWNRIIGSNPSLQDNIIEGLKKELKYRERSGTMMYLNNIDTWLRNYTWEKWLTDINDEEKNVNGSMTKI